MTIHDFQTQRTQQSAYTYGTRFVVIRWTIDDASQEANEKRESFGQEGITTVEQPSRTAAAAPRRRDDDDGTRAMMMTRMTASLGAYQERYPKISAEICLNWNRRSLSISFADLRIHSLRLSFFFEKNTTIDLYLIEEVVRFARFRSQEKWTHFVWKAKKWFSIWRYALIAETVVDFTVTSMCHFNRGQSGYQCTMKRGSELFWRSLTIWSKSCRSKWLKEPQVARLFVLEQFIFTNPWSEIKSISMRKSYRCG